MQEFEAEGTTSAKVCRRKHQVLLGMKNIGQCG